MLFQRIVSLLQKIPTTTVTDSILDSLPALPIASQLDTLVTQKALFSSFITNIRQEITFERVAYQLTNIHYNHSIYFIGSILFIYLYGQWKFFDGNSQIYSEKLRPFKRFTITERVARELIFIFIFILFKDVESAI
jgi:hypothetical protein